MHCFRVEKMACIGGFVFIVLAVLTPLATTLVTFLQPKKFASSAKVLHSATSSTPLATAVQLLVTRSNLDLVISDLDLAAQWGMEFKQPGKLSLEKCREMLIQMIKIEIIRGSSIIALKVFSEDREEAATIANKLTQVYCRTVSGSLILEQALPNPIPARPNKKLNMTLALFVAGTFLTIGIGMLVASRLAVKRQ